MGDFGEPISVGGGLVKLALLALSLPLIGLALWLLISDGTFSDVLTDDCVQRYGEGWMTAAPSLDAADNVCKHLDTGVMRPHPNP